MKASKPLSRENSNSWRNWRRTSIRVFVGLNLLLIVGFYAATSSFHLGLSHIDESSTAGSGGSDHGRQGKGCDSNKCKAMLCYLTHVAVE